jgi:DNA-binding transcriptional regulator LsrR (DeoR family)
MKNLLKQKDLSANDKIIILTINDNLFFNECSLTSNEIASATGISRKKVIDSLDKLVEMNFINCKINGAFRSRTTTLTQRLQNLITE